MNTMKLKTYEEIMGRDQYEDITGKIGPFPTRYAGDYAPEWPMFSFSGPSMSVWQGIANGLAAQGATEQRIKEILQSKLMRWALDGSLSDDLRDFGYAYAMKHGKDWKP